MQRLAYANFIAYVKLLADFSSFFLPTFSVKEDGLLIKPFQKPKQGSMVHRQFAAEEWDRYVLSVVFVRHFSLNVKTSFTQMYLLLIGKKQENEDAT